MTTSIISKLQINFDNTKFGNSIELTNETKETLNNSPFGLKEWQKELVRNGPNNLTDYYRDPTINVVSSLETQVNLMKSVINSIEIWDNNSATGQATNILYNTFSTDTINYFKKHTSNISGLTTSLGTAGTNIPDHVKIMSLGQTTILLVHNIDGSANALPLLGCMTSLFVNDEITSNTAVITNDIITLQNSKRTAVDPDTGYSNVYSNLSSVGVDALYAHALTANNLLWDRRTHDFTVFGNSMNILNDYMLVNRLGSVGNTQTYLINNYIGTDLYKEKLLSS